MNKAILIGRLVADPEMRSTQSGKRVASYRLAVDRQLKKEGQPEADFLPCIAWGNNAEFAEKYLQKGMKIALEGRIQVRSFDGNDGKKVYITEILVDRQEFCESKGASGYQPQEKAETQSPQEYSGGFVEVDDNELPF